jgi:hypothetical protein
VSPDFISLTACHLLSVVAVIVGGSSIFPA